jgi:hypothetical protein
VYSDETPSQYTYEYGGAISAIESQNYFRNQF